MTDQERRNLVRRGADRRSFAPCGDTTVERRSAVRRNYMDRRTDSFWHFSWLRACLSQQLAS